MIDGALTTHLELRRPPAFRPDPESGIVLVERPSYAPEVRELTLAVGRDFNWDCLTWDDDVWNAHLTRPGIRHWVLQLDGHAIGIASVDLHDPDDVQIESFGLVPDHHGRGIGRHAFTAVLERIQAEAPGVRRIWLSTTSDDHPNALRIYLAHGFVPFAG